LNNNQKETIKKGENYGDKIPMYFIVYIVLLTSYYVFLEKGKKAKKNLK